MPTVPGISLDREGFRARYPTADKLRFNQPPTLWKVADTTDLRQTISLNPFYGNPARLRVDLLAPGMTFYCPQGLRLKVSSTVAPYLSWREGSVSAGVPTPDVPWALLSFADNQPPYILGVPDGKTAFQVSGKSGDWTVEAPNLNGWLRVGLATGTQPAQANSAAALGKLTERAALLASLYTAMPPELKSLKTDSDIQSVTATWTFTRTGAVMPTPLFFSGLAGYSPQVSSPSKRIDAPTEEGPLDVCTSPRLVVRFPVKRVPTGRALALDPPPEQPLATVSYLDIPSIVGLAFENLVATRDSQARTMAESVYAEYLAQAAYTEEPNTHQKLPYDLPGRGLDLCAAQALLMQSTTSTMKPSSEENALLTSVALRMDRLDWTLVMTDRAVGRRAAALACVAASICPEPERRLLAGMLHAGLAGERGRQIWLRRQGAISKEPALLDALSSFRQALFTIEETNDDEGRFAQSLLSPLRAFGTTPVRLTKADADWILVWPVVETKPGVLTLASGYPIKVAAKANLAAIGVSQAFGFTEIRYTPETAGQCEATLTLPAWAKPIPPGVSAPPYHETIR